MEILYRLARDSGMTVVTVIHQPRPEIIDLIDDIFLLARGGRVAYAGPRAHMHAYFHAMGYVCPPTVALADYLADVVNGVHGPPPSPAAFLAAVEPDEGGPTPAATAVAPSTPVFADTAAAWSGGGAAWLAERLLRRGHGHLVSLPSVMAGVGGAGTVQALLRNHSAPLPANVARLPSMTRFAAVSMTAAAASTTAAAISGGSTTAVDGDATGPSAFAGTNPMYTSAATTVAPGATALPPGFTPAPPAPMARVGAGGTAGEDAAAFTGRAKAVLAQRGGASFLQQVWLSAKRAALQHCRGTSILSDMAAQLVRRPRRVRAPPPSPLLCHHLRLACLRRRRLVAPSSASHPAVARSSSCRRPSCTVARARPASSYAIVSDAVWPVQFLCNRE